MISNNILISTRHAPYGNSLAREALDVALTFAAFDHAVSLLFLDDGVLQLLPEQAPDAATQKSIAKILQSLALYEIDNIYADASAMHQRGVTMENSILLVTPLDAAALADLMQQHETVLSF